MSPGSSERREPPQVRLENIHLAEDAGLLVGDPGGVKLLGVLWGEEVPTFPSGRKILTSGLKAAILLSFHPSMVVTFKVVARTKLKLVQRTVFSGL